MIFINDPWFYAVAIPAVLITGISKTGLGSGSGGIAVPLMSQFIAPAAASGIMLPILCLMDLLGLRAYQGQWSRPDLRKMLPPALLGIILGGLMVGYLSVKGTKTMVGAVAVGFALYQFIPQLRNLKSWLPVTIRPWLWCGLSGFTSTLAHAGGPPATIYLYPRQLDRKTFVATTVFFFTFVNAMKIIPFAILGQLNLSNLATSLILMPLAPIGVWLGVRLNRVISDLVFRRITISLLFTLGCKLLFDGLT